MIESAAILILMIVALTFVFITLLVFGVACAMSQIGDDHKEQPELNCRNNDSQPTSTGKR